MGQAQLWNVDAVPKQPALVVAAYSALLLASLQAFGPNATRLIRPCPAGDARPTALPVSTSSPCCAKKWSTILKAPNPWASTYRPRPHPGR